MFRHRLTLLCLLGALAFPAAAQEEPTVFRSDSRLVVLHATVLDENGALITTLPQTAFKLFENGIEQNIKVFRREDAPVSIGLVIDDSGSMIPRREKVAAAGLGFIRASHPENEVFVQHFNEKTYLDTDFTNDTAKLERGLTTFDSRGTTAMRDAVRLAITHLEKRGKEDKKILIVVSDGEDNTSHTTRDYVVKQAQQAGVIVYAVGLLAEVDDDRARAARQELESMTQATGGRAFFLNSVEEIGRTTAAIARDIRNQYTLAYTPTNEALDGTYRRLDLQVNADRPVTVRTRAGYWAGATAAASAESAPAASTRP
jgi:VWFA-related protein